MEQGRVQSFMKAPSRPLSAYNFFFREERKRFLRDKKKSGTTERGPKLFCSMGRAIADRWNSLDEGERAPYRALAAKDQIRFKEDKRQYERYVLYRDGVNP